MPPKPAPPDPAASPIFKHSSKTRLDGYTDDDIDDIVWNLNSTPRKCLGYKTHIEAFATTLGVALEK